MQCEVDGSMKLKLHSRKSPWSLLFGNEEWNFFCCYVTSNLKLLYQCTRFVFTRYYTTTHTL